MMEEKLRRALLLSRGDPSVFVTQSISAVMLAVAAAMPVIIVVQAVRSRREAAFH